MKITKKQLRKIIREEYSRIKRPDTSQKEALAEAFDDEQMYDGITTDAEMKQAVAIAVDYLERLDQAIQQAGMYPQMGQIREIVLEALDDPSLGY